MKIYQRSIILLLICVSMFINGSKLYGNELRDNTGPFLVYDHSGSGMFAIFSGVLGALEHYENGNFAGIEVNLHDGMYLDPERGPNWWEYFFEPINIGDESAPHYVFTLNDHLTFAARGLHMDRYHAFGLIQKYIHVKPHIQEKVDTFVERNFNDYFVIGVHHRGTDKSMEMPLVSYDKTIRTVNWLISGLNEWQKARLRIYVATDDAIFLTHMQNMYPNRILYNDHVRSDDGQPIHYSNDGKFQSMYQKGEEALLDCLLLSRCNMLVRPWSSLSIVADYFNPDMPTVDLWGDT